jgi:GT2 family glycosyltransferase
MTEPRPKVTIVTPIHNGKDHTLKFLESLKKQTHKNLSTIIVDDGSDDGSSMAIAAAFPEVRILKGDGSLWWSGATNLGVQRATKDGSDFIVTVNNDVELESSSIENLVEEGLKHPKSLVGSIVCDMKDPGRVWYFGGYRNPEQGDFSHRMGRVEDFKKPEQAEWLTGMGTLIPKDAYDEIGLYDKKNFPQYYGDADFSLRAKKAGYSLWVTPKSIVVVDLTSSWLGSRFEDKSWSFIPTALFSIRSQFNLMIRLRFYLRPFVKYKIKKALGKT